MQTCPDCRERNPHLASLALWIRDADPYHGLVCRFCNGTGVVDAPAFKRWRIGEAMRRARVKRGSSQCEQAALLGIPQIVLNDIEHGRADAPSAGSARIAGAVLRRWATRLPSKTTVSGVWSRLQAQISKFCVTNNLGASVTRPLVGKGMTALLNPSARPFNLYGQSAIR